MFLFLSFLHLIKYSQRNVNMSHYDYIYFLFTYISSDFLFMYLWLLWVFVAVCGLSLVTTSEGYSLGAQCFSLRQLLLLQTQALGHVGFSSCGPRP